ncbi:hypothetical protein EXN66_Car016513 [Channa argus]|uniref:Uncharacterized protein n=1 Tax=Channa argus TaxID=215402 RepID=A0A6G1QE47_CHAAH|nr:hypothetical protein EXN66_Car016513 [Channa argus]
MQRMHIFSYIISYCKIVRNFKFHELTELKVNTTPYSDILNNTLLTEVQSVKRVLPFYIQDSDVSWETLSHICV